MLERVLEWGTQGLPGCGLGRQSALNLPGDLGGVLAQEVQIQYQTLGQAWSPSPQHPKDSQSSGREYRDIYI